MAGRYPGWHRRSGDVDASPEARALGKQLLGYLAEQRRLSGAKTLSIQRTASDGSVVRAAFYGDQPQVFIQSGAGADRRSRLHYEIMQGLVAQPRSFADDHAYGAHPEALLTPRRGGTLGASWLNYLYDATYLDGIGAVATGFYQNTPQGAPLFGDGLPGDDYTGLIDWRSRDETQVVCWHGPQSRYFPIGQPYPQGRSVVFYNGQVLVDLSTAGLIVDDPLNTRYVLGAALHGSDLLVAAAELAPGFNAPFWLRFYKVAVAPDLVACPWLDKVPDMPLALAPRLAPVTEAARVSLLLSIPYDVLSGYPVPLFKFNQSATECRAIIHASIFDDPPGDDYLRVSECIVDFRDHFRAGAAVSYSDTVLVKLREAYTGVLVRNSARINAYNQTVSGGPNDGDESYYENPYVQLVPGGDTQWLVLDGTYTVGKRYLDADGQLVEWYRGGVDYRDDAPVYVDFRTPVEYYPLVVSDGTATALRTRLESTTGNWIGDNLEAASTLAYSAAGVDERPAGFRCVDPAKNDAEADVVWLQVVGTRTRSAAYVGSASFTNGYMQVDGGGGWIAGDFIADITESSLESRMDVAVFYLDLRYRNAAYTEVTKTDAQRIHTSWTAALDSGAFRLSFTRNGLGGTNEIRRVDYHGETRVRMYGEEVASYSGDKPTDVTTTATSGTGGLSEPWDFRSYGWLSLGAGILPFHDDARYTAALASFPVDFNAPYTGFATEDASDSHRCPLGVYYWELTAAPALALAGNWPKAKHLSPAASVYIGAWGCLRKGWVFSMADLSGTTTTQKWDTRISGDIDALGDGVDQLTGKHGLESVGAIWPTSMFVVGYTFTQGPR